MPPSRTLSMDMAVHKDSITVAYVAQDLHAAVSSRGAIGTCPGDMDQRIRNMPSKRQSLVFVYEAGPCGYWFYRYLTKQGHACWVVAPALIPHKAGDRVNTHRRDAIQLARLRRSGALTPVSGPQVADAALRARQDARRYHGPSAR
jgi:transposase